MKHKLCMYKLRSDGRLLCFTEECRFDNRLIIGAIPSDMIDLECQYFIVGPHTWNTPKEHLKSLQNEELYIRIEEGFGSFSWDDVEIVEFEI